MSTTTANPRLKKNMHVFGYVAEIGPPTNPNWFTGTEYSAHLNEAKVFRTSTGARQAARYWQTCDHNPNPLPDVFFAEVRARTVELRINHWARSA